MDSHDIDGIFLAKFDTKRGNNLIWHINCSDYDNLEFKSLPSGIHDISDDNIRFTVQNKIRSKLLPGIAFYKQNGLDIGDGVTHIDRSKVKMYSLGLIFKEGTDIDEQYFSILENLLIKWLNRDESETFDLFANFFRDRSLKLDDHIKQTPLYSYFPHWIRQLGTLVFPLWKSCLLNQRILILSPPGHRLNITNALCLCLKTVTRDDRLKVLYTIGTSDLDSMENILFGKRNGYIASTTDELLAYKEEIYDVVLKITPVGEGLDENVNVKLFSNTGDEIKSTPHEMEIYQLFIRRQLDKDLGEDEYLNLRNTTESLSWLQYFVDGFYFWTTAGMLKPSYHEINSDGCKITLNEAETDDTVQCSKNITDYFLNRNESLYNALSTILSSKDQDDFDCVVSPLLLTKLNLDCFSAQDYVFIERLCMLWFNKKVTVNSSDYLRIVC